MKKLLIFILVTYNIYLSAQTDSIEKNLVYSDFIAQKIDQSSLKSTIDNWRKTVKKFDTYPEMPVLFDSTYGVSYLVRIENQPANRLYNRINEWFSTYGKPADVIKYSNIETGKIISDVSFNIPNSKLWSANKVCHCRLNISLKENKILFEISKIEYEYTIPEHVGAEYYSPAKTVWEPFSNIYPIIRKPQVLWTDYFDLIIKTKTQSRLFLEDIVNFIETYDKRYNF